MQKTAVIVSGTLRHLEWASTSWKFDNADYFLVVEDGMYAAQSQTITGSAYSNLCQLHKLPVNFISTSVVDGTAVISPALNEQFPEHATNVSLKMAHKWMIANSVVQQLTKTKKYIKVIILRPDLFLFGNFDKFNEFNVLPNTVHTVAPIQPDANITRNYPVMGDVLLSMDVATLAKLSDFYSYFLDNYHLVKYHQHDVHSLLAKFMQDFNITVAGDLSPDLNFVVLRDNMNECFTMHGIKPEITPGMLSLKQQEWWTKKYG